jgi:hypothetical protein
VTMDPSATSSSYSAYLFVRDNSASVGPVQQVQLAGTSNANGPAPALTITPASLDFTGTPVGATVTKSVTLSNIGAADAGAVSAAL